MTQQEKRAIVNGPGNFDLMLSLFDGKGVEFTLEPNIRIRVRVTGLKLEDGSGKKWLISLGGEKASFEGYYNTFTREGWARVKTWVKVWW